MSKKLAIRGHSTHGKEVIELLEMMGGNNCFHLHGLFSEHAYYFIGGPHNDEIRAGEYMFDEYAVLQMIDDMCFFTLEEFLEKFPFKVGDFVGIPEYESEVRICKMKWCPLSEHVEYLVYRNDDEEWYTADELLEYNDNPNEITDCKKCGLHFGSVQCFDKDCPNNTPKAVEKEAIFTIGPVMMFDKVDDKLESEIIAGYEFDKIENGKIILKPIKFEYPKTYRECCDVLSLSPYYNLKYHTYEPNHSVFATSNELRSLQDKLNTLSKLLICYNAYRKIAGEQMGLDKPWEPDWSNNDETKFCIYTTQNIISLDIFGVDNRILAFPTEELRDIFYDNFKHLIEQTKELL